MIINFRKMKFLKQFWMDFRTYPGTMDRLKSGLKAGLYRL